MHHDAKVDEVSQKPDLILFYNDTKVGLPSCDQMVKHKRKTNRWPLAVFHRLIDFASLNNVAFNSASVKTAPATVCVGALSPVA